MYNTFRQTRYTDSCDEFRVRFTDLEDQQDNKSTREGRKAEKTTSSKEERRKTQSWFQGQFSGQMDDINDARNIEFVTAAAAAAYAITLLEKEEESFKQNKTVEQLMQPTAKIKSRRDDSFSKPTDLSRLSRWLSGKEQKEDERQSGGSSVKMPVTLEGKIMGESVTDRTLSGKAKESNLTTKKTPTFSDKYLNDTDSGTPEQGQNQTSLRTSSMMKPVASFSSKQSGSKRTSDSSTKVETKVDAWERAKKNRIREKYEKLKAAIAEWENEKKSKARRRLDRKEVEVEQRRTRAIEEFRNEISRINKIADGTRAVAEERRRNDELKIEDKSKKMRSTGKDPPETCPCF